MAQYTKNKVDNVISVCGIVTALQADLRTRVSGTESHDFPEIFYMAQGRGQMVVNGVCHILEAGQMIIYGPDSVHGSGTGGVGQIISFETEQPLSAEYYDRVITLTGAQRVRLSKLINRAIPLFEMRIGIRGMVLKNSADPYVVQEVKNELELFLLELFRPGETYEGDKMIALTDYMMKNIGQVLTIQQISDALGVSTISLKRLVNATCGKTPMAYFRELKIEEAKRLLAESPMNVSEVANRLGFSSVHHFSRAFREKTGVTPSEYKKGYK